MSSSEPRVLVENILLASGGCYVIAEKRFEAGVLISARRFC